MFAAERRARARATWRWGGALAGILVFQSLVLVAIFWAFATGNMRRGIDHGLLEDCAFFALTPPHERPEEIREKLTRDVHRDRFLALFDAGGRLVGGNVATMPTRPATAGPGAFVTSVRPTELPGKTRDVARVMICPMPDGSRLLTGIDLDDTEEALALMWRSLLLGLVPGLLLATGFGLILARRAAKQVDAVRRLAQRIVAGDLGQRLPVAARPDSFDLLCAHINAMLDQLQTLVAEVRGVGDDIAHQMRTPLTRLRARLERGLRDADDREAFVAVAERTLAEVDTLLGIVAALLRLRELENHERRSRFAPVDLARLVEDACDLHRPIAEDAGSILACEISGAATVEGDASLLFEALANLIDNAIKFGPPGGRVVVRLSTAEGVPVIGVADDGEGIAATERALVIQRFYRGRRDVNGVGLGLALVKGIVDLHEFYLRFGSSGSDISIVCEAPTY
ncbi:ATP-binding protein [uncultured Sphingomonas sp.]|uniref:sensor histidine kinase n=1 Tax=uncultured Sphingomonas sp. TaxID=158754 RepID=UPI0025D9580C|nr:ATP-binding protein [uncultured Sphingomonas sp.]